MDPNDTIDLNQFSEQDRLDLQRALNHEMQKSKIQESVHSLTDLCWTKCVTGKIGSGALDRGEEACARNCVERFLEANTRIIRHLEGMRARG